MVTLPPWGGALPGPLRAELTLPQPPVGLVAEGSQRPPSGCCPAWSKSHLPVGVTMSPVTGHGGVERPSPLVSSLDDTKGPSQLQSPMGSDEAFLRLRLCLNPPAAKSHVLPSHVHPSPPTQSPGNFPPANFHLGVRKAAPSVTSLPSFWSAYSLSLNAAARPPL